MAGKYMHSTLPSGGSDGNENKTHPVSAETVMTEFSRLSDVQETFDFYSGQLDNEPDNMYNARSEMQRIINDSINNVKRVMLEMEENPENPPYDNYKLMEELAVDNINEYFSYLKYNSNIYGEGFENITPYQSIAFYPNEGNNQPRI